jgi:formylglycine-generating enzyme required for sulfatase activity
MLGNVWEWCSDCPRKYTVESQVDPTGPEDGPNRVLRGGGWFRGARLVRSAYRGWHTPGVRSGNLGFRLLSSAAAEPTEAAQVPVAEQGPELARFGEADEIYLGETVRVTQGTTAQVPLNSPDRIRIRSNLEDLYLRRTPKPPWAIDYGWDSYGVYADFEVASRKDSRPVTQRLRWIPPGQFEMGSPETESGRDDDEVQHAVTISTGFWLFDTPCTQGLWLAVMDGENPSRFTDLQRPVERVSWDDSVTFAGQLSQRMGIDFGLPSEAQWEYACRAGT